MKNIKKRMLINYLAKKIKEAHKKNQKTVTIDVKDLERLYIELMTMDD